MKFSKRHLILIPCTMVVALVLVSILAWVALEATRKSNGFTRSIRNNSLSILSVQEKRKEVVDIIGAMDKELYFQTLQPGIYWVTDLRLGNQRFLDINLGQDPAISSAFSSSIDSPYINILASNKPAVIISSPNEKITYKFPGAVYTRAVRIGKSNFIFRGFDSSIKTSDQIFFKGTPATGEIVKESVPVAQTMHDAGISTDGWLSYDKRTSLLTYVYFYKNEFVCIDTNLNVVRVGKTIDTTTVSSMKAGQVNTKSSGIMITNTVPKKQSNGFSCVDDGKLYNVSKLKADNQSQSDFSTNTSIDVYDIKSAKYLYSFEVPGYKSERLSRFRIINGILVALYKKHCVLYSL
jgi:hypothetical protein